MNIKRNCTDYYSIVAFGFAFLFHSTGTSNKVNDLKRFYYEYIFNNNEL